MLALGGSLRAQDFIQNYSFVKTGPQGPGTSFANTGVTSFFMSWSPQTSMNTCSVQADSSSDGSSWGNGDLIASQSCTTAGSATTATLGNGKNFVRVNVTVMSGTGGLNVTLKGWGGAGGGSGLPAGGSVGNIPVNTAPGVGTWQNMQNISGLCTASQGCTGVASPTAHALLAFEGASAAQNVCTPPATNGDYSVLYHVTGAAAVDPTCPQIGLGGAAGLTGAATTYTVLFSDNGTVLTHDKAASGAINVTLNTATALGNPNFAFRWSNHSAQTDTITPTTWTIQGNASAGGATLTIASGAACTIKVDPNSATNWVADCATSGGSPVWSSLTNATGNLSLNNTGFNTTFSQNTSGGTDTWTWQNTTAALVGTCQPTPNLVLGGTYWTGAASATDSWTIQGQCVSGSNGNETLNFSHAGSTGSSILGLPHGDRLLTGNGTFAFASQSGDSVEMDSGSDQVFLGTNSSNAITAKFGDNNSGTSLIANFVTTTPGQKLVLTTMLKATAALTSGQVVKIDSANANSIVVAATTDTGAGTYFGFVENAPGAGAVAQIALPGSIITDPLLGTGTCTIGQFVINDTTTSGRVKCTGTFTAGTILGYAITAQAAVGSAVSVYVLPR